LNVNCPSPLLKKQIPSKILICQTNTFHKDPVSKIPLYKSQSRVPSIVQKNSRSVSLTDQLLKQLSLCIRFLAQYSPLFLGHRFKSNLIIIPSRRTAELRRGTCYIYLSKVSYPTVRDSESNDDFEMRNN